MDLQVKEEYDKLICLKQNHNQPILMVVMDEEIPLQDRILCEQCFRSKRQVTKNIISIDEAKNIILEKLSGADTKMQRNIDGYSSFLENLKENLITLKSSVLTQIDEILRIIELWKTDIVNTGKEISEQSYINYFELLFEKNNQEQTNQMQNRNQSHFQKVDSIFQRLMNFEKFQICYDMLKSISPKTQVEQEINKKQEESIINEIIQIQENNQTHITQEPVMIQEHKEIDKTIQIQETNIGTQQQAPPTQRQEINIEAQQQDIAQTNQSVIAAQQQDIAQTIQRQENKMQVQQQDPTQETNIQVPYQIKATTIKKLGIVKQNEYSFAMAFNQSFSILAAGCFKEIKIWQFDQGLKEQSILKGFANNVLCIVFSKKYNWLAAGSRDSTIRLCKQETNQNWLSTTPAKHHTLGIQCLIINGQEDQLISSSIDKQIKVWLINYEANSLQYDYTLESKHSEQVNSISLNSLNTSLISCSNDKKIILWFKGNTGKWEYSHHLNSEDHGYRISFISETLISFQQSGSSQINLYELQGKQLKKKDRVDFINSKTQDNYQYFPICVNTERQIIVQKHCQFLQIINYSNQGKLKVLEQIDCGNSNVYGCLTSDGQYLATWNYGIKGFQIYQINYEY